MEERRVHVRAGMGEEGLGAFPEGAGGQGKEQDDVGEVLRDELHDPFLYGGGDEPGGYKSFYRMDEAFEGSGRKGAHGHRYPGGK